tara:strand:- start:171 stop:425 length:255 start_codon:yes stop_codon:yes gene_type:complete
VLIGVDEKLVLPILISIGLYCKIVEEGTKSLTISNVKVVLNLLFEVSILELIETLQNKYPEQALSSTLTLTFSTSKLSVISYCN